MGEASLAVQDLHPHRIRTQHHRAVVEPITDGSLRLSKAPRLPLTRTAACDRLPFRERARGACLITISAGVPDRSGEMRKVEREPSYTTTRRCPGS
jgi:HD superfamily phosphodiesterase